MPKQKVSEKFILKQSLRVFRKKGYHHTKMEDIAAACGLLKGSLYHYYKSKQDLMKAVIQYMHDFYGEKGFKAAHDPNLGGKQRLQLLADMAEEQFFASESGCLFGNLALETFGNEPELSEMVKRFFVEWRNTLTHIFAEKYPREEAQRIAADAIADIEGAVMMMRIFNDRTYLQRAHQRLIHIWDSSMDNATVNKNGHSNKESQIIS